MNLIRTLIFKYSALFGIDPYIAMSIAKVESGFNPQTVGSLGEIGLFQIRPEYVTYTPEQLFDIETNIKTGLEILSRKKKHCPHKGYKEFIICYNVGVEGSKKIKHPKKFPYYKKVMKEYEIYTRK